MHVCWLCLCFTQLGSKSRTMVNKCKLLLGCAHDEVCLAIISSLLFRFIALVVLKAILSPSVHVGVVPQPSCLCALGWQPNLPHLASLSPAASGGEDRDGDHIRHLRRPEDPHHHEGSAHCAHGNQDHHLRGSTGARRIHACTRMQADTCTHTVESACLIDWILIAFVK